MIRASLHSYGIMDDGSGYQIELSLLTEDGSSVMVLADPREILDLCSGISDQAYRALRLNAEAKEPVDSRARD